MKKLILICSLFFITKITQAQINGNFTFETLNRTYITYVPSTYTAGSNMPLVMVLHGFTQTANGIMGYSNFNAIAEANKFIAVYPNGTGFLQSWNSNIGAAGVNDFGFLNALLDTMQAKYSINTNRIYVCGFSNGGFMSNMMACLSNRFAAIAAVSGPLTEVSYAACAPTKKIPVLLIHGNADAIVGYGGTAGTSTSVDNTIAFWNGKNACPTTNTTVALPDLVSEGSTVERIEYKPCANNTEVQLLKITGGGHQWPSALSNSGIGNTNQDINASQEIWNFFNKFGIPLSIKNNAFPLAEATVFPNPSSNFISVQNSKPAFYEIQNMQGQIVLQGVYANKINIQNLAQGTYLILLKNAFKTMYCLTKFIKE